MRNFIVFFIVVFLAASLTGCASLTRMATDIKAMDATEEVAIATALTQDLVETPWDNIVQIAIGYGLALLRRKYKVSKGAK